MKINPIPTDFHYIDATLGLKRNDIKELNEKKWATPLLLFLAKNL